jgi:hypothetical protein
LPKITLEEVFCRHGADPPPSSLWRIAESAEGILAAWQTLEQKDTFAKDMRASIKKQIHMAATHVAGNTGHNPGKITAALFFVLLCRSSPAKCAPLNLSHSQGSTTRSQGRA